MLLQQHPDYWDGWHDARDGAPLILRAGTREYRAGWLLFHWAKRGLRRAGIIP